RSVREIKLLLDELEGGDETLPTDADIGQWGQKQDSESWLDINYEDFERELAGKGGEDGGSAGEKRGFGDKGAQENLRKMVERFEAFMKDEDAGAEGVDDMDFDDDEDQNEDDGDDTEEEEGGEVKFDEEAFAKMMRELMGLPPDGSADPSPTESGALRVVEEVPTEDEQDYAEIKKVSEQMEAELRKAGALILDPTHEKLAATDKALKGKAKQSEQQDKVAELDEKDDNDDSDEVNDEEPVDIDFNLAKNLLESLKGQGGMAGPAGNLMGMMGVNMPRDEDEDEDE
ncbi:hypothetical protein LTS18_007367, partial [Coniosporium uncinatum]